MDDQIRLKQIKYRSWHRGCKETDLLLGAFADEKLAGLDAAGLNAYEQLLDENDSDIWNWITGKAAPKPDYIPLLELLLNKA